MKKKNPVYITGHRHPDTDSIASSIAYAFFKKSMGIPTIPCRLGSLNAETSYLLDRFGFEAPMLLQDARMKLSEIEMDSPVSITPDTTIYETLQIMQQNNRAYCGVVDEEKHLLGMVTKSDVAVVGLDDTARSIDILAHTSSENIRKTLNGQILYDDADAVINGKVSIIAMTMPERLDRYDVEKRIVIVGADTMAQKKCIQLGAGMLIIVWADKVDESVIEEAKAHHCPIILSGHGTMNTSRYLYFAPSVERIMKRNPIFFHNHELAEDVGVKMLRNRYRAYPVVDQNDQLVGYISRYHIMDAPKRKLILVDHNEFSQSVNAIEKSQVLEVIDHHRINDFSTSQPVAFRNEIVGSTATIVATIFRENQIPIPPNLAGLLLGAVLSDTMDFHSPTTTEKDISTANILAAIADLDIEEFAQEMFSITSNQDKVSFPDMINQDLKIYDIHSCKLSISQVIVPSARDTQRDAKEITAALDRFAQKKYIDLAVLVFTSILENGSVIYAGGTRAPWAAEAFPNADGREHSFQENLLSRKQQILPALTSVISEYIGG
ncbi:putative manganese-dependent inorganic diphosphatase [Jingyaoa shaoxingensis]|uniref:inorganic diphosphatase n=1 Tax=Jingyaoa shaoxingensis TaxID=2763671 RepID=A0ABR7NC24_9FIRM|nr:putative manganese-dependent inorganic diphosphatase [Jingyaoa shaoxingensis]MBC8573937.1 putative manganese-dependent inorganic diphosphatase [Jingyaoa shaoxingensis]